MIKLLPGLFVLLLFSSIIYYLIKSYKTKGTTCTSCTSCPLVNKCNKDTIKKDMLNYYKKNIN